MIEPTPRKSGRETFWIAYRGPMKRYANVDRDDLMVGITPAGNVLISVAFSQDPDGLYFDATVEGVEMAHRYGKDFVPADWLASKLRDGGYDKHAALIDYHAAQMREVAAEQGRAGR